MQKILEIAENERIYVAYKDLQHEAGSILGLYTIHPRAGPLIVLDRMLPGQHRLHRCVAAHELGHHYYPPRSSTATIVAFCRSDYTTNSQREIIVNQDEQKALRWATELLMPSEAVWAAAREGCNTVPLLAELFHVEEWFARFKVGFIRREEWNQGRKHEWKEILCRR